MVSSLVAKPTATPPTSIGNMPNFDISCKYCGHNQTRWVYVAKDLEYLRCERCTDKDLVVVPVTSETKDIFGYNQGKAKPDAYIKKS